MTGVDFPGLALFIRKENEAAEEAIYTPPKDPMAEPWAGRRFSKEEVTALSGIADVRDIGNFEADFCRLAGNGNYTALGLDLYLHTPDKPAEDEAHRFADAAAAWYPFLQIRNLLPQLRRQRTIKQPCEIAAMRKAMTVTREGILAMMHASHPGMYEYEYKAEFDHALETHGVLHPAFPSIIAVGRNNFCIHYYGYSGRAQDGDMVLNDVAACWDNEVNDVSRGWPVNGKFTKAQAELYQCAYNTSEHMFHTVRPGIPMASVDKISHQYCFEQLRKLGKLQSFDQIGKYMWHNGAHHIGYDVHDVVDMTRPVSAGMVFCIDIGLYDEEQNIGFRIEDNCLVTENGCENLSASIPRSIEEIEQTMRK